MGKRKDLTTAEKQKTKLLSEEISTLKISKELCRDYWLIKKAVENITKLRTQSKGKGWDECKLKWVITKQPLLTSAQIFEKAGIEGVKKDKMSKILCELWSVKKSLRQPLLTKANILKCQNWAKKYTKMDFFSGNSPRWITSDIWWTGWMD